MILVVCNNPEHARRRQPSMVAEFSYDPDGGWVHAPGGAWSVMGAAPPSVQRASRTFRAASVLGLGVVNLPQGLRCKLCDQRLPPSIDTAVLNGLVAQGKSQITIHELNLLSST
jgi:hypothetical protein